jgi:hypothetical protein
MRLNAGTVQVLLWGLLSATAACLLAYTAFVLAGEPAAISDAMSLWVYHGALVFAGLTWAFFAASSRKSRLQ